ncbi:unnamed protein product [Effrenium voratum]|nr:unnamed protein product [Effrenium voratum]
MRMPAMTLKVDCMIWARDQEVDRLMPLEAGGRELHDFPVITACWQSSGWNLRRRDYGLRFAEAPASGRAGPEKYSGEQASGSVAPICSSRDDAAFAITTGYVTNLLMRMSWLGAFRAIKKMMTGQIKLSERCFRLSDALQMLSYPKFGHWAWEVFSKRKDEPWLHSLLTAVGKHIGLAVLLNTSFNSKGKPIANSVKECLEMLTQLGDLDFVLIEDWLFAKPS